MSSRPYTYEVECPQCDGTGQEEYWSNYSGGGLHDCRKCENERVIFLPADQMTRQQIDEQLNDLGETLEALTDETVEVQERMLELAGIDTHQAARRQAEETT